MSDRQPVYDAPFGSPEASEVKVYRIIDGIKVLVREEDPFDPELAAGETLGGGPGERWSAGGADGRREELGVAEASPGAVG